MNTVSSLWQKCRGCLATIQSTHLLHNAPFEDANAVGQQEKCVSKRSELLTEKLPL